MSYVEASDASLRKTGQIKLHGASGFAGMRKAGALVAKCLDELTDIVKAGMPTSDIDQFVQSQNPKMQILDPLNEAGSGSTADTSYGTDEAQTAVSFKNAAGMTNGIGSQGLQASSADLWIIPNCEVFCFLKGQANAGPRRSPCSGRSLRRILLSRSSD